MTCNGGERITLDELLKNPDKYQPLGSYKSVRNKAFHNDIIHVDMNKVFLLNSNLQSLTTRLYRLARSQGMQDNMVNTKLGVMVNTTLTLWQYLQHEVYNRANKYAKENDFNLIYNIESNHADKHNYVEVLKFINQEFCKHCHDLIDWSPFIPNRTTITVGEHGQRKEKRMTELLAHDIPTIDLYDDNDNTYVTGKVHRGNNQVPAWQASMHNRHYETDNESFNTSSNRSLETPIYGYDMTDIYASIDKWKSPGNYMM